MSDTATAITTDAPVVQSRPDSALLAFGRAHRRWLELVFAIGLYFGFASYVTWPLVIHLGHDLYGPAGDPFGTMAFFRELVEHHHNPFLPGTISQFASPEGQLIPWPRDLASMPEILTQYLLTAAFGSTASLALYTLLGYTLSGTVMFLFVRRLTANPWAALIAGWAFAFFPFAIINGQAHVENLYGWVLVLGVWRMIELVWHPTRRNGVLAGVAVVFGMWWTAYFILLGGVAYVMAVVASLAIARHDHRLRSVLVPQAIAAGIVAVFLVYLGLLSTAGANEGIGVRTHNIQELITYSARPLEYVLPDGASPLFGSDTAGYLTSHTHGSNAIESTLYVGVTVIVMALLAFGAFLRRKLTPRLGRAVFLLSLIAVAALITSAPPEAHVFGVLVPFPSHFIFQVTSTWRVYSRFVIVVMLCLSALAAISLDALARQRRRGGAIAIVLIAGVAIPLDLWSNFGGETHEIPTPSIYKVLARQPPGLVAEYPLAPFGASLYFELFYQNIYDKPIIDGYLEGSPGERRALSFANLADPTTAPRLAALGVRYVLVNELAYYSSNPWGVPPPGTPGKGFRLIAHVPFPRVFGGGAKLYLVTAQPSGPALASAGEGFSTTESTSGGYFNWQVQHTGTIAIAGNCSTCNGVLEMALISFARPRAVTISDARGRTLARFNVPPVLTHVSVPVQFAKRTDITISTVPGPQSINKTTGGPDPRSVSVQVGKLNFVYPPHAARTRAPVPSGRAGKPDPRSGSVHLTAIH